MLQNFGNWGAWKYCLGLKGDISLENHLSVKASTFLEDCGNTCWKGCLDRNSSQCLSHQRSLKIYLSASFCGENSLNRKNHQSSSLKNSLSIETYFHWENSLKISLNSKIKSD